MLSSHLDTDSGVFSSHLCRNQRCGGSGKQNPGTMCVLKIPRLTAGKSLAVWEQPWPWFVPRLGRGALAAAGKSGKWVC